jgi:signal transduction histidine kinase
MYVAWFARRGVGWAAVALISASILFIHLNDPVVSQLLRAADFNALTRIITVVLVYAIMRRLRQNTADLHRAKRRLESVNRQKDTLFGIISHDLRNPLGALITFTEMMKNSADRLPSEKVMEYARLSYEAASRACALLQDLLDWAQLQLNLVSLQVSRFDIGDLMEDCARDARPAAIAKGIEITVEVDGPLEVHADPAAVKVVLNNLLNNALKFTQAGGRITLAARVQGEATEVSVSDTGVGIPEDRLTNLYAIDRVHSTPGTEGEAGTGMGLVLCKELIERCGGHIAVTSKVGEGSRFVFTLLRQARSSRLAA